ncbi:hypothetical protein [Streptomyces sp. NPDC048269]|uniref:hypothetical protein n=1 Tax=Streptomyces sp. NPDC048269 TaxID=3155753 RepID=UPI00343040B7
MHSEGFLSAGQRSLPADTGFVKIDENRIAPGWFVGSPGRWYFVREDAPGAVYKQFVHVVLREDPDSGFQETYVVNRDQLRDVAER